MNKYHPRDLQIFVATRNRLGLLKETLESILVQSAKGFEIIVLDNSTNDETGIGLKSFAARGVKYVKTDINVQLANFKEAQKFADKKYCILFHDDDLMHPQYIERALECLNKIPNLALVTGRDRGFYTDNPKKFPKNLSEKIIFFENKTDWGAYLFTRGKASYAATLYSTKYFKKADLLFDKFEKNHDVPFMIEGALKGAAAVIYDVDCIHRRQHPQQDCRDASTAIKLDTVFNRGKYFLDLLDGNNKESKYYRLYHTYAYTNLKDSYGYLPPDFKKQNPWENFVETLKQRRFLDDEAVFYGNYRKSVLRRIITASYRVKGYFPTDEHVRYL